MGSVKFKYENLSETGKVRNNNEDSTIVDEGRGIMILADGVGGENGGELASTLAVTEVHANIVAGLDTVDEKYLGMQIDYTPHSCLIRDAVIETNKLIFSLSCQKKQYSGMGTTLIACLFHDNIISIVHVGDSRFYRLRGEDFSQITSDHSISLEEIKAQNLPAKTITRALGSSSELEVDLIEEVILQDDVYLLCSDGLNNMVDDKDIYSIVRQHGVNLHQTAKKLMDLANSKGGRDNISIALAKIVDVIHNSGDANPLSDSNFICW